MHCERTSASDVCVCVWDDDERRNDVLAEFYPFTHKQRRFNINSHQLIHGEIEKGTEMHMYARCMCTLVRGNDPI